MQVADFNCKQSWMRLGLGLALLAFWGCGRAGEVFSAEPPSYRIERPATNQQSNRLIISFRDDAGYEMVLGGHSFSADVDFGQRIPLKSPVLLTYESEGNYELTIEVYQPDGTLFVDDVLKWEYSLERPPDPIVSFSEEATKDEFVTMQISASRGEKAIEVQVSGDLAETESQTQWRTIPNSHRVDLEVTAEDGLKEMSVKLRNIYGNESDAVEVSIIKKSNEPTACQSFVSTNTSKNGIIRLEVQAETNGQLFYKVLGDVHEEQPYQEFEGQVYEQVRLSEGEGLKTITVHVRDLAQNFCEVMQHQIDVNASYQSESIEINEGALWTDERDVELKLHFDQLPGDEIEMYLSGNISEEEHTMDWVPYEETVTVRLNHVEGTRIVYARFRRGESHTSPMISAYIYLKPFIYVQGSGAQRSIVLSDMLGLEHMSIGGCQEPYVQIPFESPLVCTPAAAEISVVYSLNDQTQVSRSAQVNP